MPPSHGDTTTTVVDLQIRTVLVAIAAVLVLLIGVRLVTSAPTTTQLFVLACLFGLALDPIVDRISSRIGDRRGPSVALLCGVIVAAIGTLAVVFGPATIDQARSFQQDLPKVVGELQDIPLIGPVLERNDVPQKIEDWASQLPKQFSGDTDLFAGAAEAVTAAIVVGLVMILLVVTFLIDGPVLVDRIQRSLPTQAARRAQRFGRIVYQVVGRYFAGSLVLATLQGLQVLVTGLILDVPLTPLLALWAGGWNLIPQIGGAVGGFTFVAVAFTVSPTVGVIAAIVFVVYLLFANHVLLPVIIGKSVDISPFTTMVAAISGFAVGGVVGAIIAAPIAGAAKAMYFELRPDAPRQESDSEEPEVAGSL